MSETIEHEGVISRVEKDRVFVRITQNTACSECHAKSMCHLSGSKEKMIDVPVNVHQFSEGSRVLVSGRTSMGWKAVAYAFFLPLVLIVLSLVLFHSVFLQEALAGIAALLVVVVYYLVLHRFRDYFWKHFVFDIKSIE